MKTRSILIMILAGAAILLGLTTGLTQALGENNTPNEPQIILATSFTYQGYLTDGGEPANGQYDFYFEVFDDESTGTSQGVNELPDVQVENGIFTVVLDYGWTMFDGDIYWLEISVRPWDETGAYTLLIGRQPITPAPFALYATSANYASSAGNVNWSGIIGVPGDLADGDDDTTYSPGYGLNLTGTAFNVKSDTIQNRVSGTCTTGSTIRLINQDGNVECDVDDDTTYSVGFGLLKDVTTFSVNTNQIQARVSGNCAVGSTIQEINSDGSVVCESHDTKPGFSETHLNTSEYYFNPSVSIGVDGLPVISYFEISNFNLNVSHCNDPSCRTATHSVIDDSEQVGNHSSIAIGADGFPVISYHDEIAGFLKVAHCEDHACTSAGIAEVDTESDVGWRTSITIGMDGMPVISYLDFTNNGLKVAYCLEMDCTSAEITLVDPDGSGATSIAIGVDGLPIIAYMDVNYNLRVAHCDDLICSTFTITEYITSDQDGHWAAIIIGVDGLPIISYYNMDQDDLEVAHCNDRACTTKVVTTLDSTGNVGEYSSITIGSDGMAVISYYDNDNGDLKVAHCEDFACTSYSTLAVDTYGNVGYTPEITIGTDGMPLIAYIDFDALMVKVMHCSNPFCIPYWTRR